MVSPSLRALRGAHSVLTSSRFLLVSDLPAGTRSPICLRCQATVLSRSQTHPSTIREKSQRRPFASSVRKLDQKKHPSPFPASSASQSAQPYIHPSSRATHSLDVDDVQHLPRGQSTDDGGAALPSESAESRSALTNRIQSITDRLLVRLSDISQQLNSYTGTDYTGISALRAKIIEQEKLVRSCHEAVSNAKAAHQDASASQSSSQKEVVQLLERKHSWSAQDLERYMSLIRSEHVNDQSVSMARDKARERERELEGARQLLERLERKQYHEEQVWSDTIRRNSTWVTFGLMALNILLLLANVVIIEPWRRSRMVREFKTALDEKVETATAASVAAQHLVESAQSYAIAGQNGVETDPQLYSTKSAPQILDIGDQEVPIVDLTHASSPTPEHGLDHAISKSPGSSLDATKTGLGLYVNGLFSEQPTVVRKVDMTNASLQGAVVGAVLTWMVTLVFQLR